MFARTSEKDVKIGSESEGEGKGSTFFVQLKEEKE